MDSICDYGEGEEEFADSYNGDYGDYDYGEYYDEYGDYEDYDEYYPTKKDSVWESTDTREKLEESKRGGRQAPRPNRG